MPEGIEQSYGKFLCDGDCTWENSKCKAKKMKPPVSCGNLERPSCKDCVPKEFPFLGKTLCNGDCRWAKNKCHPKEQKSPAPCIGPDWACKPSSPPKVNCKLSLWATWSPCSKSCNGGSSSRRRSVLEKEQHGGQPCSGLLETQDCNTQQGPGIEIERQYFWLDWSHFNLNI